MTGFIYRVCPTKASPGSMPWLPLSKWTRALARPHGVELPITGVRDLDELSLVPNIAGGQRPIGVEGGTSHRGDSVSISVSNILSLLVEYIWRMSVTLVVQLDVIRGVRKSIREAVASAEFTLPGGVFVAQRAGYGDTAGFPQFDDYSQTFAA